jgi:hypothetical protein
MLKQVTVKVSQSRWPLHIINQKGVKKMGVVKVVKGFRGYYVARVYEDNETGKLVKEHLTLEYPDRTTAEKRLLQYI